jgi:hypothetical protein
MIFNKTNNCRRYVQVILRQLFPELTEDKRLYGWFQQESATPTLHVLYLYRLFSSVFGDRIISSGIWPARSPDLNPCDIFFWGCLKDKLYNRNPQTEKELKENVCRKIANFPAEQFQRVRQNPFCQCEECLRGTCRGTAFSTHPVICEL